MQPKDRPDLECSLIYPEIEIDNVNILPEVNIPRLSAIRDWRPRWISYYFKQYYRTLLDVSCGNARNLLYYRWKGLNVQGTEFTDELVNNCLNQGIPCEKIDLNEETLPFRDNSFDVVTCTDVIEHLKYPLKTIYEIIRVAKSIVFIATPMGHSYEAPDHLHHWNIQTFISNIIEPINHQCTLCMLPTKPEDSFLRSRVLLLIIDKTEGRKH